MDHDWPEARNLSAANPVRAGYMQSKLRLLEKEVAVRSAILPDAPKKGEDSLPADLKNNLKALGYLD